MRSGELDYGLDDVLFDLVLGLVLLQALKVLLDDLFLWDLGLQPQLIVSLLLPLFLLFLKRGAAASTRKCLTDEVCNLLLLFFHRLLANQLLCFLEIGLKK